MSVARWVGEEEEEDEEEEEKEKSEAEQKIMQGNLKKVRLNAY